MGFWTGGCLFDRGFIGRTVLQQSLQGYGHGTDPAQEPPGRTLSDSLEPPMIPAQGQGLHVQAGAGLSGSPWASAHQQPHLEGPG